MTNILDNIQSPSDLRKLSANELLSLSEELRSFIIDVMASHQGHLAASLGTVELAIALHYAFNTPYDRLIWDVGHQAYPHKILTGRRDYFNGIRTLDGISGFPSIFESEYDAFSTGHSSTSISAALGMAIASELKGEKNRQHIAVIGDGSMTGGLALEGLNNAGVSKSNILVVLNDNGISIDKSSGALSRYFTKISTSHSYNRFKDRVWNILGKNATGEDSRNFVSRLTSGLKSVLFRQGNLFEALNFRYFGPINGHDIPGLIRVFNDLKHIQGPKLLHIVTTKGKGLRTAENEPTVFHSPGLFNSKTGELIKPITNLSLPPRYQDVFGKTIIELAQQNDKIVGITPAMPTGCSLNLMMKKMPSRTFDVGIAEQHAVTFSAGLAIEGMIPFCNIYSSFMQRAYDQIIHDVALQKLPVVLCLDRAGLVGEDGATHHGAFDLAYLRPIPNLTIASPLNETELRDLMYTAQLGKYGTFVIRYPRGRGTTSHWKTPLKEMEVGKGRTIREGKKVAFISIGHIGNNTISATQTFLSEMAVKWEDPNQGPGLFSFTFLKPLDTSLLDHIFKNYETIYTIEDGVIEGGLGSAVCEFAVDRSYANKVHRLGIPTEQFVMHGTVEELQKQCGYSKSCILALIRLSF